MSVMIKMQPRSVLRRSDSLLLPSAIFQDTSEANKNARWCRSFDTIGRVLRVKRAAQLASAISAAIGTFGLLQRLAGR